MVQIMTYNERIYELIESTKTLTIKRQIKWKRVTDYLDSNDNYSLKHFLVSNNRYIYSRIGEPTLEECESYCSTFMDGLIFLFIYKSNFQRFCTFALQPTVGSEISKLTNEYSFQTELSALKQIIEDVEALTETYINSIIEHAKQA